MVLKKLYSQMLHANSLCEFVGICFKENERKERGDVKKLLTESRQCA